MSNALSFLLLIALGAVAWLWRGRLAAEKRSDVLSTELEALEVERKDLLRRFEVESLARKKQSEELAELRRRSDKVRRRTEKTPEVPLGTAARIRDIEVELERAQASVRRAEAERESLARRADGLQLECSGLARRLEEASAPANAEADRHRASIERVQTELAVAREQLQKQADELVVARQTEARMRKRMDNQEQLYASLRAELDVKKDRLRTQEEQIQRLQALKAAVLE